MGGPHEDWQIDEALAIMLSLNSFLRVGGSGLPLAQHNLIMIAKNVVANAKMLLDGIKTIERVKPTSKEKGGA